MKNFTNWIASDAYLTLNEILSARICVGHYFGMDSEGNQIYVVRSNLQGGDAAYEVTVAPDCSYVSHQLLWAE